MSEIPAWFIFVVIFIVLDFFVVLFVVLKKFKEKSFRPEELQYIRSHWIRIIDSLESHPKQAVMDADKLLDYALSRKGFNGTVAEKLKASGPRFSDLNGLWNAHKLRNRIAHELSDIQLAEAKQAMGNFKNALNDLGAKL